MFTVYATDNEIHSETIPGLIVNTKEIFTQ